MPTSTRSAVPVRPKSSPRVRQSVARQLPVKAATAPKAPPASAPAKPEPKILFQKFFKSVGPRTYAAQVKELLNGNHLLVLTEGKRDAQTGEVRKTRLFVYGEDFTEFFRLLNDTVTFMRANPVPPEVRQRRQKFWTRKARADRSSSSPAQPNSSD